MEMIQCPVRTISPRDSLPFQFVFDIFALRVGNDLTYYLIIRKRKDFRGFSSFYIEVGTSLN